MGVLATIAVLISIIAVGVSDAGIGRSGIASGRITRFASIFVNGREFGTETATVIVDGQAATVGDLKLGQTVFVRGIVDSELPVGVADEVVASSVIDGPITSIDSDEMQLTVLGKMAFADADSVVERLSGDDGFENLAVGDRVAISGFRRSDGSLLASRIEETAPGGDNRVVGEVNNLVATSFQIDDLVVDFGTAEIGGFPSGAVREGDNVRVRGSAFGVNGELIASKVEFVPGISSEGQDVGEFEGFIADFSSAAEFSVAGVRVVTNSGTGFVGGGAANLTTDTNVTVRGDFDAAGQLVASEVTIRGTQIRVYGLVTASSEAVVTVLETPVIAAADTHIEDSTDADVEPFGITDMSVGDYVETSSFKNPPATTPVVVERIERDDEEDDFRLDGFLSFVDTSTISVLGTTVYISNDTEFSDANDNEITLAEFLDGTMSGTFVQVRGDAYSGLGVTASKISFQLHD